MKGAMDEGVGMREPREVSRRRVLVYLGITFGLTWTVWIVAGLVLGTFTSGINSSPTMLAITAVSMFFPLVGALLTNVALGRGHRLDLCLRPHVRGNVRWYLASWLLPTALTLLGSAFFFLLVSGSFDASAPMFWAYLEEAVKSGQVDGSMLTDETVMVGLVSQIGFAVVLAPFINMIAAFGEEAGWRGMLFPSLTRLMTPRRAVLLTGVIWGLWHAPITIMGHNYGMGYPGYPVLGILVMIVFCTSLGSCLTWLRLRTGSVWPCALAHGALNAVAGLGTYFCTVDLTLLGPSPAGLVACIPFALLGMWCCLHLPASASES